MRVKYIKADTPAIPVEKEPALLKSMNIITYNGNSVFSPNAEESVRNGLISAGFIEGEQFAFYKNRLYFLKSIGLETLQDILAYRIDFNVANKQKVNFLDSSNAPDLTGEVEAKVWETIDISGGLSKINGLLNLISSTLKKVGFSDNDFVIKGGTVLVNVESRKRASDAGGTDLASRRIVDCVFQILKSNNIVHEKSDLSRMITHHGLTSFSDESWSVYPFPVSKDQTNLINLYQENVVGWLKDAGFKSGTDYVISLKDKTINLNRFSDKYKDVLDSIHLFENENGYYSSFPHSPGEWLSPNKRWKEVKLFSKDPGNIALDDLIYDLHRMAFIEGEDYTKIEDKLFVNVSSRNFGTLNIVLFRIARDKRYGIDNFAVEYQDKKPKKIDTSSYWGKNVYENFPLSDPDLYIDIEMENIFKTGLEIIDGEKRAILRKFYAEKCIESLLKAGIFEFYATFKGEVYYLRSQADEFEKIVSAFDKNLKDYLAIIDSAQSEEVKEQILEGIMGKEDYAELKASGNETNARVVLSFWTDPNSPFYFMRPLSDFDMSRALSSITEYDDVNAANEFSSLKRETQIGVVRGIVADLGIYPGYSFNLFPPTLTTSTNENPVMFEDLAISRSISLGHDYKNHRGGIYEYLIASNNFNCLKVNSFLSEFLYNSEVLKGKKPSYSVQAVSSIFFEMLNGVRNHPLFAPIPDSPKKTKERNNRFFDFIRKIDIPEDFITIVVDINDQVFKGKEEELKNLKTVSAIKSSPYYKEIVRLIKMYIAGPLAEVTSCQQKV